MTNYEKAYELAHGLHFEQVRKHSNAPYMVHILKVIEKLGRYGFSKENNEDIFVTAFLHDTFEDTDVAEFEIKEFGDKVFNAVKALTYPARAEGEESGAYQAKYSEHMGNIYKQGLMALVVKVADRICNVEDFIIDKPSYAYIYWRYAEELITSWIDQQNNLIFLYDKKIYQKVIDDIIRMDSLTQRIKSNG